VVLGLAVCAATAGLALPRGAAAGVTSTWVAATSGDWTFAGNWSTNPLSPNNGNPAGTTYDAVIGAAGPAYAATLTSDVTLDSLTLSSPAATLIHSAGSLAAGTVTVNAGKYLIDSPALRNVRLQGGGGTVELKGGTFDNVTLARSATLDARTLSLTNGLTLDGGSLSIAAAGTSSLGANISARGSQQVGGAGEIIFDKTNLNRIDAAVGGGTLMFGPGVRVRTGDNGGAGTITAASGGTFVNQGTISSGAGGLIGLEGRWINQGHIENLGGTVYLNGTFSTSSISNFSRNGGFVWLRGVLDNTGQTLDLSQSVGTVEFAGGTIKGGTLIASELAPLKVYDTPGNRFEGVTIGSSLYSPFGGSITVSNNLTLANNIDLRFTAAGGFWFEGANTLGGSGTITVEPRANSGFTTTFGGGALTIGPNITIRGVPGGGGSAGIILGGIGAPLTNNGTILAAAPTVPVTLNGSWTNAGTIAVSSGCLLMLNGQFRPSDIGTLVNNGGTVAVQGTVDLSTGSLLVAPSYGRFELWDQARLSAGKVATAPGGELVVQRGTTFLDRVELAGAMRVASFQAAQIWKGLTLSGGTVTVDNAASLDLRNVPATPVASLSIDGTGRVVLSGGSLLTYSDQPAVTFGAGVTIAGGGVIRGGSLVTSNGTVSAGSAGLTLTVAGTFNNAGVVEARNGAVLSLTNPTQVVNYFGGTLTGGRWEVFNGSTLSFGSAAIATNKASIRLDGASSTFVGLASLSRNIGTLSVTGGRTFQPAAGAFTNSGSVIIGAGSGVRIPGALANTGTVDVGGAMVIDYGGASPIQTIASQVATGYAGGVWTGGGITSSAAAAIAADGAQPHKTAVGYAEAATVLGGATSFAGMPVDGTTVLLRYTLFGDASLDGVVDLTDFTFLASHFNAAGGALWSDGDFNYDGKVDLTDFTLLASNFNTSVPADGDFSLRSSLGSAVPEPASFVIAAAAAAGLVCRCRRRRPRR
jgi:fibronectin-binding autotransporter adhesin